MAISALLGTFSINREDRLVVVRCQFDGKPVEVPAELVDEDNRIPGVTLPNGVYVSPCRSVYCTRECYADYCSD